MPDPCSTCNDTGFVTLDPDDDDLRAVVACDDCDTHERDSQAAERRHDDTGGPQ